MTLDDIRAAAKRVSRIARVTPLLDVSPQAEQPLHTRMPAARPDTTLGPVGGVTAPMQRPSDDPLAILAEAAADLGISDTDDISLKALTGAIAGLVSTDER